MPEARRPFRRLLLLLGLAACSLPALAFLEKEVRFSEAEVQARLDRAPPFEKRYGELLVLRIPTPPKVSLGTPQPDRLGLQARAEVSVLGQPALPVDLQATAGLRYDDAAKAFFLEDPRVERVEANGLPPELQPALRRALGQWLNAHYRNRPVYELRSDGSPQEATARWLLRSVRIEPGRVVAVLSPF